MPFVQVCTLLTLSRAKLMFFKQSLYAVDQYLFKTSTLDNKTR